MRVAEAREIVRQIVFRDRTIAIFGTLDLFFLQVSWMGKDRDDGDLVRMRGRKWVLSQYMTKSELVQTAFKAILTAEEHEIREDFTYRGSPIFGPHYDVDSLVGIPLDERPNVDTIAAPQLKSDGLRD